MPMSKFQVDPIEKWSSDLDSQLKDAKIQNFRSMGATKKAISKIAVFGKKTLVFII